MKNSTEATSDRHHATPGVHTSYRQSDAFCASNHSVAEGTAAPSAVCTTTTVKVARLQCNWQVHSTSQLLNWNREF